MTQTTVQLSPKDLLAAEQRRRLASIDFASGLGDSAWMLYGLVRSKKPAVCVEIGSARGKSACHIGLALQDNRGGELFAIDPHTATAWNDCNSVHTYETIVQNINVLNLANYVKVVRQTSAEAVLSWSRPIDILFIDGDHSYEGVKRDFELFGKFVSPFGIVVFHDTIWDLRPDPEWSRADMGVPKFVDELRVQGYPVVTIDRDCGTSIVQPQRWGIALTPGPAETAKTVAA
jgi:predicted O-methyltransferase YrrM